MQSTQDHATIAAFIRLELLAAPHDADDLNFADDLAAARLLADDLDVTFDWSTPGLVKARIGHELLEAAVAVPGEWQMFAEAKIAHALIDAGVIG